MKKYVMTIAGLFIVLAISAGEKDNGFKTGKADIKSFSTMVFNAEGILFVGDSKDGKVYALDFDDTKENKSLEGFEMANIEEKIAAYMGTSKENIIIHDMAVNPISQNIYLAVSRNNAKDVGFWKLPNDLGYANILLKIDTEKNISELSLENVSHSSISIPNNRPVGEENWRKSDRRTETVTDIEFYNNQLFVAGISNEEFASTLRVIPFPFKGEVSASTIEIWHAAHGKFETESPIRTLLPYNFNNQDQLLAAYTCTPLVAIPLKDLENNKHVKSTTLAELGSGNIPLDIIAYQKKGVPYILIANSSRSLIRIDINDLAKQEPVTEDIDNGNVAGVPYTPLSKVGILQIDNFNVDNVLTLQRMPNGDLDLRTYTTNWL